jgi:hypothetical protein
LQPAVFFYYTLNSAILARYVLFNVMLMYAMPNNVYVHAHPRSPLLLDACHMSCHHIDSWQQLQLQLYQFPQLAVITQI